MYLWLINIGSYFVHFKPLYGLFISTNNFSFSTDFIPSFFIEAFPQNKKFWKRVDYWWVSLGVIAIIGAIFSYRKETFSAWIPWHKQSLKAVYSQYQDDIRQVIDFSDTTGYFIEISENSIQKKKMNTARTFFNLLLKQVDSCKDFILNDEQYELIDSITNPYRIFIDTINEKLIIDVCASITFMSERAKEESNILIGLRKQGNRDTMNWILLLISPYLFAIAIAIRLTKVTVKLKEL